MYFATMLKSCIAMVIVCLTLVSVASSLPFDRHGSQIMAKMAMHGKKEYLEERRKFFSSEFEQFMGHDIILNEEEELVNQRLMEHKIKEYDSSAKSAVFLPAMSFLTAKKDIDKSEVYKIIRSMPKGAVLHIHDASIVRIDWLIKNATYRENCYIGIAEDRSSITFKFAESTPQITGYEWNLVADLRKKATSAADFDEWIRGYLTMVVPDPSTVYTNQNDIWVKFLDTLETAVSLIFYEGLFPEFVYEAMSEAMRDNIQYMEIRSALDRVYSLDGTVRDVEFAVKLCDQAAKRFLNDHPDFSGIKLIQQHVRHGSTSTILGTVKESIKVHKDYPHIHLGYDLVGQEDLGHTLLYYYDALHYPAQHGDRLPFYFHAGETDWQGTDVDENLIDAVLFRTRRIGHGYAIPKHPGVMAAVKKERIAIEVNPISNQVLGLLQDLRNHPMVPLIAQDYPIVISSDDPSVWDADILSHDFYVAFMALGGKRADLRLLKKFAMNSLQFSGMDESEKKAAFALWEKNWNTFIKGSILS